LTKISTFDKVIVLKGSSFKFSVNNTESWYSGWKSSSNTGNETFGMSKIFWIY